MKRLDRGLAGMTIKVYPNPCHSGDFFLKPKID